MEHVHHASSFDPSAFFLLISFIIPTLIFSFFKFSKIKVLAFLLLAVFLFTHVSPDRLVTNAHHGNLGNIHFHPCCIPQLNNFEEPKIVKPKISFLEFWGTFLVGRKPFNFDTKLNNKSPPPLQIFS